ncbi:hypothetical protein GQ457_HM001890 [Hibiscus cannabinus]
MRRSNPDLTSSSEMRRSNEFKSCFTIRRAEGSDKLQIPSNRQRCSGSNYSDLASSSGMRRSTFFRSCFIVRDEKVNISSDLASSSGMKGQPNLDLASSSGMRRSTNSDLASSSEMRRSTFLQILLHRQG